MNEIILTAEQIEQKLERIAYQILEANSANSSIVVAGIMKNGYAVAERISDYLEQISTKKIVRCQITIDKKNPLKPVSTSLNEGDYSNESVTIVDDVLHSGTTLIYAVRHFLSVPLKQCKTAVLVDRNHKKFPIKADFKGVSLSTSINENVVVEVRNGTFTASLI
ncbi:MAG: phosphoribosyltransferase [Bacteroidetes bacterium]|nr:phosphoribosyltransferase [Bacteroidota bacterium]